MVYFSESMEAKRKWIFLKYWKKKYKPRCLYSEKNLLGIRHSQKLLAREHALKQLLNKTPQKEGKQWTQEKRSEGRATEVLCICVTIINYSLEFFKVYMMIERENFFFLSCLMGFFQCIRCNTQDQVLLNFSSKRPYTKYFWLCKSYGLYCNTLPL